MTAGLGLDELAGHTHTFSRSPYAAFQYVTDAKFISDLPGVGRFPLVGERRVAGDDEESPIARQGRDDVLDYPVDEVVLFRAATEIDERQDRDRWLVGNY